LTIKSEDAERDAALEVAKLMLVAARTAPKARGRDTVVTAILAGEDKNRLADFQRGISHRIFRFNCQSETFLRVIRIFAYIYLAPRSLE